MPSTLSCRAERDFPIALLRVAGSLDLLTAPALRRAVHKCLAEQPTAVYVDVSAMRVAEPLALAVFAAVTRQAAEWPAVPIIVCAPHERTVHQLRRSAVCRSVAVLTESCEEAMSRLGEGTAPHRVHRRLGPVLDACRQGRETVLEACRRWNLPEVAGPASVIVSELVANVVRHARTPMDLTVAVRGRQLSMAVRDGSPDQPVPATPDVGRAGGRGLLLVRELADRWGTLPVADGKVVWATVSDAAGVA